MPAKRFFSKDGIPEKSADYHGTAHYARTSPDVAADGVKSINVYVPFEEAVRLSLAIQSCAISLNRFNRNTKAGLRMGLLLSFKTESKTVTVIEAAVCGDGGVIAETEQS